MSVSDRAVAILNRGNVKTTWNRLLIVDYLLEHPGHWCAEEIYQGLDAEGHAPVKATVYNSLHALEEGRVLRSLDALQGEKRFELADERHAHAVCTSCGLMVDVALPEALVETREFPDMEGFTWADLQLTYYGLCKDCQTSGSPSPKTELKPGTLSADL